MSDPTQGGRSSLNYVKDLRAQHGEAADATRAVPSPRTPSTAEKLQSKQASISEEGIGSVAKGARQVAANRLADQYRKEHK